MPYLHHPTILPNAQAALYFALLRGLEAEKAEIKLPKAEPSTLSRLYEAVRLDHPHLIGLSSFRISALLRAPTLTLFPTYAMKGKALTQMTRSLQIRTERILSPLRDLPAEDALLAMRDFFLAHVVYDKVQKHYSHEIIGVLHHGIGVCEGIAKTVKHFCDCLDIDCLVAIGNEAGDQRHAWNLIRTDTWRSYDFTFDLSASARGIPSPRFLGLTREEDLALHGQAEFPLPWDETTEAIGI